MLIKFINCYFIYDGYYNITSDFREFQIKTIDRLKINRQIPTKLRLMKSYKYLAIQSSLFFFFQYLTFYHNYRCFSFIINF